MHNQAEKQQLATSVTDSPRVAYPVYLKKQDRTDECLLTVVLDEAKCLELHASSGNNPIRPLVEWDALPILDDQSDIPSSSLQHVYIVSWGGIDDIVGDTGLSPTVEGIFISQANAEAFRANQGGTTRAIRQVKLGELLPLHFVTDEDPNGRAPMPDETKQEILLVFVRHQGCSDRHLLGVLDQGDDVNEFASSVDSARAFVNTSFESHYVQDVPSEHGPLVGSTVFIVSEGGIDDERGDSGFPVAPVAIFADAQLAQNFAQWRYGHITVRTARVGEHLALGCPRA